jgi:hypothetical protein
MARPVRVDALAARHDALPESVRRTPIAHERFAVLDDVVACAGTDDPDHDAENAFVDSRVDPRASPIGARGAKSVDVLVVADPQGRFPIKRDVAELHPLDSLLRVLVAVPAAARVRSTLRFLPPPLRDLPQFPRECSASWDRVRRVRAGRTRAGADHYSQLRSTPEPTPRKPPISAPPGVVGYPAAADEFSVSAPSTST